MKHDLYVLFIIVAMMISVRSSAQEFEVGIGLQRHSFTRDEVEIVDAIDLFNFAARQSGGDELPNMQLKTKNFIAPVVFGKFQLEHVPLTVGLEFVLKGFNAAAFAEYEFLLHDGEFSVFARPRVSLGWNSKFPVHPDWKQFLADELPDLTASEIEEGAALFAKLSPSSLGTALSLQLAPQIDVDWTPPIGFDFLFLRGSLRYQWDVMTLLLRSQSGWVISVSAVAQFGG